MQTITLTCPEDVHRIVPRILGFQPTESLVILGLGPNVPSARVDLDDIDEIADGIKGALPAWQSAHAVGVVVYSDDPVLARAFLDGADTILPDVNIVLRQHFASDFASGDPVPEAALRREDFEERAQRVESPDEAIGLAAESYKRGNGAHAWAYIDRAEELIDGGAEAHILARGSIVVLSGLIREARNPLDIADWLDAIIAVFTPKGA